MAGNEAGGRLGIHKVQHFTNVAGLCNFGHAIHDHHQFRDHKLQVMPLYIATRKQRQKAWLEYTVMVKWVSVGSYK